MRGVTSYRGDRHQLLGEYPLLCLYCLPIVFVSMDVWQLPNRTDARWREEEGGTGALGGIFSRRGDWRVLGSLSGGAGVDVVYECYAWGV